ncbi:methyl-accepting chemotaxis protein [Celerinatantimonas sp. YJH-8]|uniref:methyl-accepting chemotaxis protein n=1 Tax=Celerinatantimonas sp. YJH-8 TaxID=3228714 RepID=UPI0038C3666E
MKQLTAISLKMKLAITTSLGILIGCVLVMSIGFYSSINERVERLGAELASQAQTFNHYIEDWINIRSNSLNAIPSSIPVDQMIPVLQQARDSSGFANVFIAYPDGTEQNAGQVTLAAGNNDPRKWEWYQKAQAQPGTLYMASPSVASATKKIVVSFGLARQINGKSVVFGADMNMTQLLDLLRQAQLPGKGQVLIVTREGNIFVHQDTSKLNHSIQSLGAELTPTVLTQLMTSDHRVREMEVDDEDSYVFVAPIPDTNLYTLMVIDKESIVAPMYQALWRQALGSLVVIILCVILFSLYNNYLLRSLESVSVALKEIAQGGGDLTRSIVVTSRDEVGVLATSFNQFNNTLRTLIRDLRNQIEILRDQSHSSHTRSQQMSSQLNQQQQDVTSVATAIEEMSSATSEIAGYTQQTLDSVKESTELTEKGHQLINDNRESVESLATSIKQASEVVDELQEHAQSINGILATIQGIAEQTNLLALNAAIEAARAGDQGRGFAVVADEVRTLSQRTHQATEEIQQTITTLVGNITEAVGLMNSTTDKVQGSVSDAVQASEALNQIKASVTMIHDMNTQIATAAEEQSQVSHEITMNSTRIKDVSEALSNDAHAAQENSLELDRQTDELAQKISSFKVD